MDWGATVRSVEGLLSSLIGSEQAQLLEMLHTRRAAVLVRRTAPVVTSAGVVSFAWCRASCLSAVGAAAGADEVVVLRGRSARPHVRAPGLPTLDAPGRTFQGRLLN